MVWLEAGPTLSYGIGQRKVTSNGVDLYKAGSGSYVSYGGRVGGYVVLVQHLVLGADVGYLAFTNDDSVDDPVLGHTETTVTGQGVIANATVGYRF